MTLEIVIPGRPVSGNHAKLPTGRGRQIRTPESREYDRRIASIALAAVALAGWKMPDFVCCDVTIANSRTDRDNVLKEVQDALEGLVYVNDGASSTGAPCGSKTTAARG